MNYLLHCMPHSSYVMQMNAQHLRFFLWTDCEYLKVRSCHSFVIVICKNMMACMQMCAYYSRWVGLCDVLEQKMVGGRSSLWERWKVLGSASTCNVFICLFLLLLYITAEYVATCKLWLLVRYSLLAIFDITLFFSLQILLWASCVWVGVGCLDSPKVQPRLTLMHHSLLGMEVGNTKREKTEERDAILLL